MLAKLGACRFSPNKSVFDPLAPASVNSRGRNGLEINRSGGSDSEPPQCRSPFLLALCARRRMLTHGPSVGSLLPEKS